MTAAKPSFMLALSQRNQRRRAMELHEKDVISAILGRRSCRAFDGAPVSEEEIQTLLACGCAAPSAKNLESCHFVTVEDKPTLTALQEAYGPGIAVADASLAVAVCVDVPDYESRSGFRDGTWMEDGAAAMQNLLLAARALGLEGVWLQVANRSPREERITPILRLPDGVRVLAVAVLGRCAAGKARTGADESRVHRGPGSWIKG